MTGNAGTINDDPLFVTGPRGAYYLSHIGTGQSADSPCVDGGLGAPVDYGLENRTTRTDGVVDASPVDMGYHHKP